jgi:hypothetical protein
MPPNTRSRADVPTMNSQQVGRAGCPPAHGDQPTADRRRGTSDLGVAMSTAQSPQNQTLTVLVDDVRAFKDGRPALMARSSQEALSLLEELGDERIDDLWLDHDLVGGDTIRPVVEFLVRLAVEGSPLDVGQIHIHTANVGAGRWMDVELRGAGYRVVRSYSLGMWTRQC